MLGIVLIVGIIGSIILLIILGLKYITGTIEEKAKYKSALMPYAIGMVMLVSAIPIVNTVYQFSEDIGDSTKDKIATPAGYCTKCNMVIEDYEEHKEHNEWLEPGFICEKCGAFYFKKDKHTFCINKK